jgi:hypothetical protein
MATQLVGSRVILSFIEVVGFLMYVDGDLRLCMT